eukprot:s2451_g15.t1
MTALLDFYTRAETDQAISGGMDLSAYDTSAETQTYVANELLAYYPRTELDSLLTAILTQYWTAGRTQSEIDDALAGSDFLNQKPRATSATSSGRRTRSLDKSGTWSKSSLRLGSSGTCSWRRRWSETPFSQPVDSPPPVRLLDEGQGGRAVPPTSPSSLTDELRGHARAPERGRRPADPGSRSREARRASS